MIMASARVSARSEEICQIRRLPNTIYAARIRIPQ